eukprot:gene464-283_t
MEVVQRSALVRGGCRSRGALRSVSRGCSQHSGSSERRGIATKAVVSGPQSARLAADGNQSFAQRASWVVERSSPSSATNKYVGREERVTSSQDAGATGRVPKRVVVKVNTKGPGGDDSSCKTPGTTAPASQKVLSPRRIQPVVPNLVEGSIKAEDPVAQRVGSDTVTKLSEHSAIMNELWHDFRNAKDAVTVFTLADEWKLHLTPNHLSGAWFKLGCFAWADGVAAQKSSVVQRRFVDNYSGELQFMLRRTLQSLEAGNYWLPSSVSITAYYLSKVVPASAGYSATSPATLSALRADVRAEQRALEEEAPNSESSAKKRRPRKADVALAHVFELRQLVLAALVKNATSRVATFTAGELAYCVNGFAKAKCEDMEELFEAIAAHITPQVASFNEQELSNTAWAYASAGHAAPLLFTAIAKECAESPVKMRTFKPQALANVAWAFAKADHDAPLLFAALASEAEARIAEFKVPQDFSTFLWAFSTVGAKAPGLFDAIAHQIMARDRGGGADGSFLASFKPQELANTVFGFAKAHHDGVRELFEAVVGVALSRGFADWKPQELSNTVWAFAKLGYGHEPLFRAVGAVVVKAGRQAAAAQRTQQRRRTLSSVALDLRTFCEQNFANILWAYAKVGYPHPKLFDCILEFVIPRLPTFKSQEIAGCTWAVARAGHTSGEFLDAVAVEARRRLNGSSVMGLTTLDLGIIVAALRESKHASLACSSLIEGLHVKKLAL